MRLHAAGLVALMIGASLSGCLSEGGELGDYTYQYYVQIDTNATTSYQIIVPFPITNFKHIDVVYQNLNFTAGSGEYNLLNTSAGLDNSGLSINAYGNITLEASGKKEKPARIYYEEYRYSYDYRLSMENITYYDWKEIFKPTDGQEWFVYYNGSLNDSLHLTLFYGEKQYSKEPGGHDFDCGMGYRINFDINKLGWNLAEGLRSNWGICE